MISLTRLRIQAAAAIKSEQSSRNLAKRSIKTTNGPKKNNNIHANARAAANKPFGVGPHYEGLRPDNAPEAGHGDRAEQAIIEAQKKAGVPVEGKKYMAGMVRNILLSWEYMLFKYC